jgi:hypothetical protein
MGNVTIKEDGTREVHYNLSDKGRENLRASAKKLHEKQKQFYKKRGKTHVLYMYEDTHRMIYELKDKLGFRATLDSLINYSLKCVLENIGQFSGGAKDYIKSIAYASKKK